jgi:hypothetical protein
MSSGTDAPQGASLYAKTGATSRAMRNEFNNHFAKLEFTGSSLLGDLQTAITSYVFRFFCVIFEQFVAH